MSNLNRDHQKESQETDAGRATKKEETTNESHKVNKGPDAAKVEGHTTEGRCTSEATSDIPHENESD